MVLAIEILEDAKSLEQLITSSFPNEMLEISNIEQSDEASICVDCSCCPLPAASSSSCVRNWLSFREMSDG